MAHDWAKGTLAGMLLVTFLYVAVTVPGWNQDAPPRESLVDLAQALFEPWVFAFELLSILLLAALVGSLYLAFKPKPGEEDAE